MSKKRVLLPDMTVREQRIYEKATRSSKKLGKKGRNGRRSREKRQRPNDKPADDSSAG